MIDGRSRRVVEVAEAFADGRANQEELREAHHETRTAMADADVAVADLSSEEQTSLWRNYKAAQAAVHASAQRGTINAADAVTAVEFETMDQEGRYQADVVREIFGNPFRPVAAEPEWLIWNHATVPAIARHIYDDRAFHDLPILADALEDAGCTNADLLDHCRGPGPHVRGCWAVDLLLGKT
jgi:hypothetical protein